METPKKTMAVALPPVGQKVMVQCEGYRGLAYRTNAGQWRTTNSNKRLPKDVEILRAD
jgi:hypothetical protein